MFRMVRTAIRSARVASGGGWCGSRGEPIHGYIGRMALITGRKRTEARTRYRRRVLLAASAGTCCSRKTVTCRGFTAHW
jgi:hypothetical protein